MEFTIVSDPNIREALSKVSMSNEEKIMECDTVIIFSRINDIAAFKAQIKERLSEGSFDFYANHVKAHGVEYVKSWMDKQLYLALGVLLSACAEMGIDATPMEGIYLDQYDAILEHSEYATVVAAVIGYRDPKDFNQPSKNSKSRLSIDKVTREL